MNTLSLTLIAEDGSRPLPFTVRRVVNAGYTGRDQAAVRAHIEELARAGVPPPQSVPIAFPQGTDKLTTADTIEVIGNETSGEAEYVLLLAQGEIFVGVGSDHTDRALERHSIIKSKQICSNVLSSQVWRYRDVKDRWDELLLRSWVHSLETEAEVVYQEAPLRAMLSAEAMLELVRSRLRDRDSEGLVIFSGTVPVVGGKLIYAEHFRAELNDPATGRCLNCSYRAVKLEYVEGAGP